MSDRLTPRQAAKIVLRRRAVRDSLVEWARESGVEPAPHHRLLIEHLEKVARGEIDRLIVCQPPGSGKSIYTSTLFPPWFLANHKTASVLAASHTTELAERWGRKVRNMVAEHSAMLDIGLSSDNQAAGRWSLESGGEYLAAGTGQAILGFRADLAVIDDPVRSREEADSEAARRGLIEWFQSELRTRLRPGGRVVVVSTRWHEADLVGTLLANQSEPWVTLILPAIAEENDALGRQPGEFLWDADPNYNYGEFLRREHATQSPMNWAALFQQRPAPEDGDYFKIEWLKPYEKRPKAEFLNVYAASDYAVSEGRGDWTVHVVVGVDPRDRMYLLDLWRKQTTSDKWVEAMLDLAERWKPMAWAEETGQIRSGVGPLIDKRSQERRVFVPRKQFPTNGNKAARAQSIRGLMALDGLWVPTKASWYPAMQEELLKFPAGKHDDIVDAIALVGQLLAEMVRGRRPKKEEPRKQSGYSPMDEWRHSRDDGTCFPETGGNFFDISVF